jgi:hypothetical protein
MPTRFRAIWPISACLVLALLAIVVTATPQAPLPASRRSAGPGMIRAAHFFGLSRYSWPINYLNAFPMAQVDRDLAQIAGDGFNAIVLLVPWGEIQPKLGPPAVYSEPTLARLQTIIAAARAHNLQVVLRLPYIWSINPDQEMPNIDRMTALLFDDRVRAAFVDAVRTVDRRLIRPNGNVRLAFATWEDFYGVTKIPDAIPSAVRERFSAFAREHYSAQELAAFYHRPLDDAQPVPITQRNEPGWQVFLAYVDSGITSLTRTMADELSVPMSFEVRVDGDPILVDGRVAEWYLHDGTYDVTTSDVTTMYYAPYLGQANNGERLTAAQAIAGMRRVMDIVGRRTRNRLFIDQFNVVFNTPGFDRHARIADAEIGAFFDKAASELALSTLGYGLWGYKDYYHNLLYNPSFELGTAGWETEGKVRATPAGVVLQPGAAVRQVVGQSRVTFFGLAPEVQICVWGSGPSGATVTLSAMGNVSTTINLSAAQSPPANCLILPRQATDYPVSVRANASTVRIEGAVFNSHTEVAGVYDVDNRPSGLRDTIVRFNQGMTEARQAHCPESIATDGALTGKFADGWLSRRVRACLTVPPHPGERLELSLFVPEPVPVPMHGTLLAAEVRQPFTLSRGWNTVTLGPVSWAAGTEVPVTIDFENEFVPREHGSSTDGRALTALFKGMRFRASGSTR